MKDDLKFQVIVPKNGVIIYGEGICVRRHHEWSMAVDIGIKGKIAIIINVNGKIICISGKSGDIHSL